MWCEIFCLFYVLQLLSGQYCPSGTKALENGIPCVNDRGCVMQAYGYKCFGGICCTVVAFDEVSYGHYCTATIQCQYLNSLCENNICLCQQGFIYDGQICSSSIGDHGVPYHGYCTANIQCKPANSHCVQNICECLPNYTYNGDSCALSGGSARYGEYCSISIVCQSPNTQCLGNICICAIGYFYDGVACKKSGGAQVGEYCSSINQCQPANSQCLGNICTCATGYFYNGVACTKSSPPTRLSCTVVGAQVEFRNGYPVNCLTADCSQGYYCEYNKFYNQGQYICCGELPGTYGKIRTYAYTNKPLECSAPTSCNVFTETPYCVFSKRYNQRVCCSTFTC